MNIDDEGTKHEEFLRDIALAKRKPTLPKIGFCHNCYEPVPDGATHCNADCRQDDERRTENAKGKL